MKSVISITGLFVTIVYGESILPGINALCTPFSSEAIQPSSSKLQFGSRTDAPVNYRSWSTVADHLADQYQ